MKHGIGHKLLSVVLAVMMLVSLLPTAAFAAESIDNGDESSLNEVVGSADPEKGSEETVIPTLVTVNGTGYATLAEAIANAKPDENGVITYEINGKADISGNDQWISFVKDATDVKKVVFISKSSDAEISITSSQSVLGVQDMDIDVELKDLTLSHPNGAWVNDLGHATNYFSCIVRNAGHTVTYTNCTFPDGACNSQYGKTVFDNCHFTNSTSGKYNLWNYGGNTEIKNSSFTGTRGVKTYNEGTLAVAPTVKIENTSFNGLTEKAAIVASKATNITLTGVSATDCDKGLLTRDISGNDELTITANGNSISGTFDITSATGADAAKNEFNITAGTFNSEVSSDYCAEGFTVVKDADGNYGVKEDTASAVGTKDNPYTLAQLGAMTRAEYIAAQTRLGGTMYVTVGDYSYDTNGVLGNGTADNSDKDSTKMNYYGAPGAKSGQYSDAAVGKSIVFVGSSITSGVTGYTSIDNIGTSLLLAVPAYTNVTFEGVTFNNVMSFNYQLYTSPWSQLGELKFDGCTFNGIIVGAIAAQTLTFNGCEFKNYTNTTYANSSNPTWIRPAYGNWTRGDNEGQGSDFRSLTTINFTGNTVTSTRPVKFERIAQWEMATTVTATGNSFDIKSDGSNKNVGMYFGANAKFDLVLDKTNTKSDNTAALYTAVYSAPDGQNHAGLPAGSTVKDTSGNEFVTDDALKWKTDTKLTLKSVPAETPVAMIGTTGYASLAAAIAAAKDGETVTLLADATEDVVINKNITLDLGGKTLTNTNAGKATISVTGGKVTVKGGSVMGGTSYYNIEVTKGSNADLTLENVTATAGNNGSSMIDNWGTLTINSGSYTGGLDTIKNEPGAKLTITGGDFTLTKGTSKGFTGVVFNYGDLTITGGTFTQSDKSAPYGQAQVIHTDKSGSSAPSTVIKGGTFKNLCTRSTAWTVRIVGADYSWIEVSGGTFNKSVSESYCADGFIPTKNADGTYGVKEGTYVAKSDTTKEKYDTLQAAIKATAKGKTVTLLTDVTENVEISKGKRVTLDLNGKTLNGGTGTTKAALTNYGTITITDSSTTKAGTIKRDDMGIEGETSYYVIRNRGTMIIESGNVNNNSGYKQASSTGSMNGSSLICNGDCDEGGTLTINGGTFTQNNFIAIKNGALGVLHVTGGKITSNHSAIQNWFKADITGGEIKGQLWTDAYIEGESVGETTIGGNAKFTGEIVMDIYGSVAPKLAITGGDLDVTSWRITSAAANVGAKPAVSGGTFKAAVPANYCAEGFIPTANADGTFGVKAGAYVAEVNGVKYETLQAAIDAAKSGATVKMLADTRENVTINKAMTLDLNGYTLNGGTEKGKPALTVTARVTVKDSSEGKTGTIMREDTAENSGVSSHYVIDIQSKQDKGWLTFEGGNVKNGSGAGGTKGASLVRVGDDSVAKQPGLVINGGTFTQDNFIVIKVDRGYLNLNGGTLNSANSYAVENWFNANIKGGTVNGAVSSWTYSAGSNSTLTISGGTVNGNVTSVNYGNAEGKKATVTITGGTVNGKLDTRSYDPTTGKLTSIDDAAKATIKVSGGTFNNAVEARYCDEGYTPVQNSDGKYGVEKAYLAKIGDTSYYTMDEAFQAVKEGETITLLRDYTTGAEQYSGSKSFAIDLNGKTWTYTGTNTNHAAFEINYPNVTLTVKNGTVVSDSMVGLIPSAIGMDGPIAYDNAGLVFEQVTMTAKGHSGIETNGNNTNDTVTLKNSTLNVPNGFGIYFPSSGTLTIENSTINAKTMGVQVCAGSLSINAGSAITVTGDAVPKTENDGAIQDGAAISIVNRTGYKGLDKIEVTGGTFKSNGTNAAIKAYDWANNTESTFTANDKVAVSGGTFSSAVPAGLCAPGYVPTAVDADGNYTVEKVMVAQIGNNKYGTLSEAIAAANAGDTVKLLRDINTPEISYMISKSLTIDLNGKTVTGDGYDAVFQIDNADAKVLIKNGNIVAVENTGSAGKYAMAIWASEAGCEVTLEGLDVRQRITHTDDPQMDMIYTSGGTIIINSGNFESGTPAWTLNCNDAAYKAGTANIIVKGGTFTGFDPANNKAEGENTNFVAAGYKSVDNNDGTYTVVKNENVVAVIGTKEYATLSEALKDAAKTGATVLLVANVDANEDIVQVRVGVTLNLNGYSITNVDLLRVTGQIIDTSDANARGIVSAEGYVIGGQNAYTPVYDSAKKGYSFFNLSVVTKLEDGVFGGVYFWLDDETERADFTNAVALMRADTNGRRVKAVITFAWKSKDYRGTQSYDYTDDFMNRYLNYKDMLGSFYVKAKGLDNIDSVTAQAKFVITDASGDALYTLAGSEITLK